MLEEIKLVIEIISIGFYVGGEKSPFIENEISEPGAIYTLDKFEIVIIWFEL